MAARFPERSDRLENEFQDKVVKRFANMTEFKKFAKSKHGLCLDEHDVQSIEEDNEYSVEDKKMKMLDHWKVSNGEMATDWHIRFVLKRYNHVETGDQSERSARLEDVFQDEIVKRFTNMTKFKKFARSRQGLCLDEHDIQQIEEDDMQSVGSQKLKMLDLWRVLNGKMATDWHIRFVLKRYYHVETGDQSDRLEDVFQDIIVKRFASMTKFKEFARSQQGLCLKEYDIQSIVEDDKHSVEEQKMRMLNSWRAEKGTMATKWEIIFLVERYHNTGDSSEILKLDDTFKLFRKQGLSPPRGHVYLGEQDYAKETSRSCAIKLVEFNEETERVGHILSILPEHKNIVAIKGVGVYDSNSLLYNYIAMEFCWTRNLRDVFEENKKNDISFDEANAKNLAKQLFNGLSYIHEKKLIHKNMKPENVLVSDNNTTLKITGFVTSKTTNKKNENVNDTKTDVFYTGIILGKILSNGHHPFGDNPDIRKYNIKKDVNLDLSHVKSSNRAEVIKLIRNILCHKPLERPTAKEVLEHDALKKSNPPTLHQPKSMIKSPVSQNDSGNFPPRRDTQTITASDPNLNIIMTRLEGEMLEDFVEEISPNKTSKLPLPRFDDSLETKRVFTSTGKEIIIYNFSSRRFDLYILTDDLIKFGETKEYDLDPTSPFDVVVAKKYLYVFGSIKSSRTKYLDSNAEWISLSRPESPYSSKKLVLNASIYNCGLKASKPFLHEYDENQDLWFEIISMRERRRNPRFVATQDHIYCIGGVDIKGDGLLSTERFDPTTRKWEVLDVDLPRYIKPDAVATSIKHQIYIYDSNIILRLDTKKNLWTELDRHSFRR